MTTNESTRAQGQTLWSTNDLARAWGMHPETIRRWLRGTRIPATKMGRRWAIADDVVRKIATEGLS